jgi:hypothetical protein
MKDLIRKNAALKRQKIRGAFFVRGWAVRLKIRIIKTGIQDDANIEVKSGLKEEIL